MARRRFVSVLLLGGVGQALTVLFLMYGAPDLALTQFMIETLMIVAFVLVLRHLPRDYSAPPSWAPRGAAHRARRRGRRHRRRGSRSPPAAATGRPTSPTRSSSCRCPKPAARNVVNVTIVDFRGVDTMGEITVFGIAALGVANLVAASRRGAGAGASRAVRRGSAPQSMIFEQVTRMIFHVTLLVSLYVMLRGHNAPGGGFAGGLIAGAAFVFRILAGGTDGRTGVARLSPVVLIAIGMLLAIGTGLVAARSSATSSSRSSIFHVDVPLIGDVKLVSAAVFDLGVYLLVIGVVIIVLEPPRVAHPQRRRGARARRDAREPRPRASSIGVLFATGTYSMLHRSLTRIVVGVGLIGNGVNLLLIVAGSRPGVPPIVGELTGRHRSDPAGAGADRDRDRLRAAGVPARARLAQLDARRQRRRRGRHRGPAARRRAAAAHPHGRGGAPGRARAAAERRRRPAAADRARSRAPEDSMNRLAPLPTVMPLLAAAIALLVRALARARSGRSASSRSPARSA